MALESPPDRAYLSPPITKKSRDNIAKAPKANFVIVSMIDVFVPHPNVGRPILLAERGEFLFEHATGAANAVLELMTGETIKLMNASAKTEIILVLINLIMIL